MIPKTVEQIKQMQIGKEWEYLRSVTVHYPNDNSKIAETYYDAYERGIIIIFQRPSGEKHVMNNGIASKDRLFSYMAKRIMTQEEKWEAKLLEVMK